GAGVVSGVKRMKPVFLFLPIPLLIVSSGCSRNSAAQEHPAAAAPNAITVSTAKAQQRDLADRIDLAGNLTADEQVAVYAKIPGYLKNVHVDIGDPVRKGELIAELEVPEMVTALG